MTSNLIKVKAAADLLGLSEISIYRMAAAGVIPGYKRAGRWFFFSHELIEWVKEGKRKTQNQINTAVDAAITSHF